MKNGFLILLIILTNTYITQAQSHDAKTNLWYAESTPFAKKPIADWKKLGTNENAFFGSTEVHFNKETLAHQNISKTWNQKAWKGERIHTQILYVGGKELSNLNYTLKALKKADGTQIPESALSLQFLRYVKTDVFAGGCGSKNTTQIDSSLVADVIDINPSIPYQQQTTQPLWLSIQIPNNSSAGIYHGSIEIHGQKTIKLNYQIQVQERSLAAAADWSFQLDYWQHPAAIARVHQVKLWSDAHFNLMKKYYTMLANAGQKTITASITDEAWNHQTFDDFPSLIHWTKKTDDTWQYDYRLFDKYIQFVMDCGIDKLINCYSMIPWKVQFKYFDEKSGKDLYQSAKVGTKEYEEFWKTMLIDFTKHLKDKAWFEKTAIAMDERSMDDMKSVIALVKSVDPDFKISLAGKYHPEIEADIYDYCIASEDLFPKEILEKRNMQGKQSTVYTCCTEAYPNGFTFSAPAESTWLPWYAAAKGFTGYLRWAYNSWVANPLIDSRFKTWPAGDTFQVYPGPRSSVRFEKMIEGIQDYEKIQTLKKEFIAQKQIDKLKKLNLLLAPFEIKNLSHVSAEKQLAIAKKGLSAF